MAVRRTSRVMFISTGLSRGGAETQLVRLAIGLRRRHWEVAVVSLNGQCAFGDELRLADVDYFSLNVRRSPRTWLSAFRRSIALMQEWDPDILVTFMYHANLLGAMLTLCTGCPSIASIRTERFGGPLREWLARIAGHANVAVTVNSANVATSLVLRGVVEADRTVVIPNAIDVGGERSVDEFRSGPVLRWLAVGRLYPAKDYPNLLHAFRKVVAMFPGSELRIAGSGPLARQLEEMASRLGLDSCVAFLGHRVDVDDLMRSSDALVLSSSWEGMPNVVMEAMANGIPVVATNVGGVSELVVDGETGLLCEKQNPQALARAMIALARMDPIERYRMGAEGRRRILSRFSVPSIVDRWENLLRDHVERTESDRRPLAPRRAGQRR